MNTREFIFSERFSPRIARHLVFWAVYCLYFWMQSINISAMEELKQVEPYKNAFVNLYSFLPSCLFTVYVFIYVLLPFTLLQKRYVWFGLSLLLLYYFEVKINYLFGNLFLANVTYNQVSSDYHITALGLSTTNTSWAFTIGILALGLKLYKSRYSQQQQNLELLGKKSNAELQLKKGRFHPAFLSRTLDDILITIRDFPKEAPRMVLKLSELLSYILYESQLELVPVEKELGAIKEYVYLQQQRHQDNIIQLKIKGQSLERFTVPLFIFKLLQDCTNMLEENEKIQYKLLAEITVEDALLIKLSYRCINGGADIPENWAHYCREMKEKFNTLYREGKFQTGEQGPATFVSLTLPLYTRKSNKSGADKRGLKAVGYEQA